MAPRGLSAEEKRVKLLEIFHETKDFYQLKELEKLGPKLKGIVSQSVKDVLQSLVDDGLVQGDKIGSSNFFWGFPSQQGAIVTNRLQSAKECRDNHRAQLAELQVSIEKEKSARPDSEPRTIALATLADLKKALAQKGSELVAYSHCDPAKMEEKRRAVFLAREAAYRWTDNYGMLLAHFSRQNGIDASEVRRFLGIDEDYEDLS